MHKLPITVAIMGLLTPVGANALGVGDIRLRSALNQSLEAEIPLVLSGDDRLEDVKISLASPEAFARAGIDRQFFLTRLQFRPVQKPDGAYAIKITSREVMQEPFLNFLVEVNWPQGRMQKEFTVLLDPPATLPETRRAAVREPAIERPIQPYSTEPAREYRRPAPVINTAPPVRRRPSRSPEDTDPRHASGEQYGPVQRRETLWGVARSVNQDPGISQEQMAVALYRYNPGAFYADNVNALKAGAVLRVPNRDYIVQRSPEEASREFYSSQSGGNYRAAERNAPVTYPSPRVAGAEPPARSQLKLLPTADDKPRDESGSSGGEGRSGKSKGDLALEVVDTVRQENDEFRSRLAQLETKLLDLQRMLVLKDQEIATLQKQPQAVPPANVVPTPPVEQPVVPPVEKPVAEPPRQTIEPAVKPPEVKPPVATEAPPVVAPPKPAVKPQPPKPAVAEETGLLDELLEEPLLLGAIGGGLLLALAGVMIMRRRAAMIAETESILVATERETAQQKAQAAALSKLAAEAPAKKDQAVQQETKSSFLSEFTTSDFDALGSEGDEVDPISEADVYLAYGRYKQAEELIGNAIEQHPGRDEFKLKLLEIHYATENQQAFQAYARQLAAQGKDQQAGFWGKVVEMGHELCPEEPMFERSAVIDDADENTYDSGSFDASLALSSMDLSDDIIEDLKRFEIELLDEPKLASFDTEDLPSEPANAPKLDFSLDFDTAPKSKPKLEKPKSPELPIEEILVEAPRAADADADNLIAFDFAKPKAPPKAPARPEKSIDDILREMTEAKSPSLANEDLDELGTTDDMHELDFDLDFGASGTKAGGHSSVRAQEEDRFAGLTDSDEMETKLDLAKAYSDMDDDEMARDILEEVMVSGTDRQKAEARLILDKLDDKKPSHGFSIAESRTGRG